MLNQDDIMLLHSAITLLRTQRIGLKEAASKMVEQNETIADILTKVMQQNCSHNDEDGTSAVSRSIFFDECKLCGKEW